MIAALPVDEDVAAAIVADGLLQIGAVLLRPDAPFTYTSGLKSPVYVDCRKIISYPRFRAQVIALAAGAMMRRAGPEAFDAVAGGETAGIPFAAWMADLLGLPMLYVRKKPKGFGRDAQIEGALSEGARVLLVEDLATDGGSKIAFAEALRGAGAACAHAIVVFHHDAFPASSDRLAEAGLSLHALARWADVLAAAKGSDRFSTAALDEVNRFLGDPYAWSAARGGLAAPPAT